jgi:integrase
MSSIKGAIAQSNGRLKRDGYRVAIVLVRDRLYLQATLPPAPGSKKAEPHQQKLSLKLPANPEALKVAERRARELGQQLQTGEFDWALWRDRPTQAECCTADWVAKFEADYWARRPKNPNTEVTWKVDYAGPFNRLHPYEPLTTTAILEAVKTTSPDTRTRRRVCLAYQALARFAGLAINLKPYRGNYGPETVKERRIPSDAEILAIWERINPEDWRWAFGMIATYGLRPGELKFCKFDPYPRLRILEGKTGPRLAYPLHPDWPDRLGLRNVRRPNCSGISRAAFGQRVTKAFKRLKVPFPPYSLRHAYAVRGIGRQSIDAMARSMGHSPKVHCSIYQKWLTEDDLDRAWQNPKP